MRKVSYLIITIAGIISLSAVYVYQYRWLYKIGLPLDDSYIHLQFARNLIKGHWFVYSIGDKSTPGDTSPLWVLLIAGVGVFYKNLLAVSLILGGIFYVLTGLVAFLVAEKFFENKWLSLAYALVVIFTGRMLWGATSGMEITLFSFLTLFGVLVYLRDKQRGRLSLLAGVIFGLASNARPEGHLFFIFVLLDWVVLEKIVQEKKFHFSHIPWLSGIAYSVFALPYPLFSFFTTGHLTPNTFSATRLPFSLSTSWDYLRLVIEFFYHDHFLLHLALPVGCLVFIVKLIQGSEKERRNFLLWLLPVGYLLVSFFVAPIKYHFQRYLIPVLPFFVLLSLYGWKWVLEIAGSRIGKTFSLRLQQIFSLVIIIWGSTITLYSWPRLTAQCVKNIEDMQVKLGYWLKQNTQPGDLIAANDIGAIFYISERASLDLVGLVNPELLEKVKGLRIPSEARDRATLSYILEKKPAYLLIFPNWYPQIAENTKFFQPVYSARLTDNIICAGDEMVVYKCSWNKK